MNFDIQLLGAKRRRCLQILLDLGFEIIRKQRGRSRVYCISYTHKGVITRWEINHKELDWHWVYRIVQKEGFDFSDELELVMAEAFENFMNGTLSAGG